jgi:hypothetical protein
MTEGMRQFFKKDLLDLKKMNNLISTRGNLSPPGEDYITNPLLKYERDSSARFTIAMMESLLNTGICPQEWKSSRTILIYKKGEKPDPGNWRLITITSVINRLVFCRLARSLHDTYSLNKKNICDDEQKGFVPSKAGCVEHIAMANGIINETVVNKKPLFVLSHDLRNAFGSIRHQLIRKNLLQIGLPQDTTEFIMESYKDATITFDVKNIKSNPVTIGKGVKQGCPLSPSLFNIAIDPLIRYINSKCKDYGYRYQSNGNNARKVIQAYADDILIFSDSKRRLNDICDVVVSFMNYARILFNPDKCVLYVNNLDKEPIPDLTLPDENNNQKKVKICEFNDTFKYLGVPLGSKRLPKVRFNRRKIESIKQLLYKLSVSGLKIT